MPAQARGLEEALVMIGKIILDLSAAALALTVLPVNWEATGTVTAEPTIEGRVQVAPGVALRQFVSGAGPSKPKVLLLHGFPETAQTWTAVSEHLAPTHEVHAFDWPGYGRSSRPEALRFDYSPRGYAEVLRSYIRETGIGGPGLTIYATDIGALPALLAAIEEPNIAGRIIVGDFAPFDRPQFMAERLQRLKSPETAERARAEYNAAKEEVLQNAFRRGFETHEQFPLDPDFARDMHEGWDGTDLTSADAFALYYGRFTRDQNVLEESLARLKTHVEVVWGARDIYINPAMGEEFARRAGVPFRLLEGIGHYPHLQNPDLVAREIAKAGP
jgi:pimeloyl-ACP methyl ester carboxylesterase